MSSSAIAAAPLQAEISTRLDALPVTSWHRRVVTLIGLGSFFNFFEVALGTLLIPLLPASWTATTTDKSLLIGAPFLGEMIGAFALAKAADRYGRRRMFQINLIAYAALALLCATAWSAPALLAIRVLIGVGLGAELTLVDTYLIELIPAPRRGRLLATSYALGMLAVPTAGILAARLPHTLAGLPSWRWLLIASSASALSMWLLRRQLPESPRWLAAHGHTAQALTQLHAIEAAARTRAGTNQLAPADSVFTPAPAASGTATAVPLRRTLLACVIQLLSPMGFYGFASIGPLVLLAKGYDVVDSLGYAALTAIGYPLGALLLIPLAERVQRRTLVMASTLSVAATGCVFGTGTTTAVIVTAGALTTTASVLQATAARSYVAELFPTNVRNTFLGRSYALSRLVSAVLPFAALTILSALGASALFSLSALLLALLATAVLTLGPRTNNRPLDQI
ncbi:MFS transporter [Streptomyces sp. TP-A0356]|uniref:MFS transporter n=1 Tax=Streptomyces sp. TP-A0356 TaxID=1359208 RepID=UPI0007C70AE7|nr:MFS transporter [Streptomyces sp. TP-A0356]